MTSHTGNKIKLLIPPSRYPSECPSLYVAGVSRGRVAKRLSVTRDGTQIISAMGDRAQISRARHDWASSMMRD